MFHLVGCLMDNTELLQVEDIEIHKNVKGHMQCGALCKEETECAFWTYVSGRCYLKTDDVFTIKKPEAISGKKRCNASGNTVYFLCPFHLDNNSKIYASLIKCKFCLCRF